MVLLPKLGYSCPEINTDVTNEANKIFNSGFIATSKMQNRCEYTEKGEHVRKFHKAAVCTKLIFLIVNN